ncbi:MAG: hypothetical protein ACI9JL_004240 [Paracoccaceae bacterium]|jgi:hypothetical protein
MDRIAQTPGSTDSEAAPAADETCAPGVAALETLVRLLARQAAAEFLAAEDKETADGPEN